MNLKYYDIDIEGIDKTGKDTIALYIAQLSNYKYLAKSRGIATMIVYSNLYNRDYNYVFNNKNKVIVFLTCNYKDWKIRCKLLNEPDIDFYKHNKEFKKVINELSKTNIIFKYNTSETTQYNIAMDVIKKLDELNDKEDK